jgi:hypothetical protein
MSDFEGNGITLRLSHDDTGPQYSRTPPKNGFEGSKPPVAGEPARNHNVNEMPTNYKIRGCCNSNCCCRCYYCFQLDLPAAAAPSFNRATALQPMSFL